MRKFHAGLSGRSPQQPCKIMSDSHGLFGKSALDALMLLNSQLNIELDAALVSATCCKTNPCWLRFLLKVYGKKIILPIGVYWLAMSQGQIYDSILSTYECC